MPRPAGDMHSRDRGVRIISGTHKGLRLVVPDCPGVRPTPDRVRETIFARLGDTVRTTVLDLFAGSGALGIEAMSRGASRVTLVDNQQQVCMQLRHAAKRLHEQSLEIVCMDALEFLRSAGERNFGLVFLDPPYHASLLEPALGLLREFRLLDSSSLIYAECARGQLPLAPGYQIIREDSFGMVTSCFMRLTSPAPQRPVQSPASRVP